MALERPHRGGGESAQRLVNAPNLNRLWADLLLEELIRCGVGFFCLASGWRSAPLATAVAASGADFQVHYDERGCAFAALGWARATGRPACWITTSGTAVANGLPAIVEASLDGVPLIAITADRPPELRHTGANQTIDQTAIFGTYTRWHVDLPPPSLEVDPAFILTTADQAVHRALHPRGPVHLNMMFREPLAPETQAEPLPPLPRRWLASDHPFTRYERPRDLAHAAPPVARLGMVEKGWVVAGRLRSRYEADAALRLAEHLGWPLIPDVCSQLRMGPAHRQVCRFADLLLCSEAFAARHRPEAVILLGGRPASKRLARLLAGAQIDPFVVVRDDPFRFDPDHRITHRIEADIASWCMAMAAELPNGTASAWTQAWVQASGRIEQMLREHLAAEAPLSEPGVAHLLAQSTSADHGVVVASSMPVRDLDTFAAPGDAPPRLVVANRGASGIDGTVATAAGVARGLGAPVTLLIGDLALLHDASSLGLLRDPRQPPVTVVVLNNDGGGIFHFLPIARYEGVFEPLFGTPHGMDFAGVAAQFGLPYRAPRTLGDLRQALDGATRGSLSNIIEVRTDRKQNLALHQRLRDAAAMALEAAALSRS